MIRIVKKGVQVVLALTLVLILGISGLQVSAEDNYLAKGDGWSLDKEGHLIIENDTGMDAWVYDESVKKYTDDLYYYNMVESVELREGLTHIERYLLQDTKIKEVTIPSTVTDIGDSAFAGCINLIEVTIPSTVNTVEGGAFAGSGLKTVVLEGAPTIGGNAFGCEIDTFICKAETPTKDMFAKGVFSNLNISENGVAKDYAGSITFQVPFGSGDAYKEALSKNNSINANNVKEEEAPPAGEENKDPETGGENKDPETGGENKDPETGGENKDPETGGENKDPETGGENKDPETGGENKDPETGGENKDPETGGENKDPETGGENKDPNTEDDNNNQNTPGTNTGAGSKPVIDNGNKVVVSSSSRSQEEPAKPVALIQYKTTAAVAGKSSTVGGAFFLNKGINVAVTTSEAQLKEAFGLTKNERAFVKVMDMDLKKSHLAKKSLDSAMTALGGQPVAYLNLEFGFMRNGQYTVLEATDKAISYAVEIPGRFRSGKFDVIRVREGGKLDILKSQYKDGVLSFETTPGTASYLVIVY